ncbi:potassium transporter TrkG, partial [Bacteroides thetaiotaomicron]
TGGVQLFSAETTGVTHDRTHPKINVMAKWLWTVYLILTVSETILLMFGGMDLFDAICQSFATTATGGYSTKQNSISYWNSPYIEYVVAIFMIISSINFSLFL